MSIKKRKAAEVVVPKSPGKEILHAFTCQKGNIMKGIWPAIGRTCRVLGKHSSSTNFSFPWLAAKFYKILLQDMNFHIWIKYKYLWERSYIKASSVIYTVVQCPYQSFMRSCFEKTKGQESTNIGGDAPRKTGRKRPQERKTNLTHFPVCLGLTWKSDLIEVFFREQNVEFRITQGQFKYRVGK